MGQQHSSLRASIESRLKSKRDKSSAKPSTPTTENDPVTLEPIPKHQTMDSPPPLPSPSPSTTLIPPIVPNLPLFDETISLDYYIRRALPFTIRAKLPINIFTPSSWIPPPTLHRGVKNRILLFSGSFNPPHIGHKQLLVHAFFRSAYDNVRAAIIMPAGSRSLEKKLKTKNENALNRLREMLQWGTDDEIAQVDIDAEPLTLPRSTRANLWADSLLSPWCWMARHGHECWTAIFAIEELARNDGFDVEFIMIGGPDYVNNEKGCEFWKCGINEIVIGDFFRPGVCRERDGRLRGLDPCTAWRCCVGSAEEALLKRVDEGELGGLEVLMLLYSDEERSLANSFEDCGERWRRMRAPVREILERRLARSGASWMCESKVDARHRMQFLPISCATDKFPGVGVSSTAIRRVLRDNTPEDAVRMLEGVVLNADMLMWALSREGGKKNGRKQKRRERSVEEEST